MSNAEFQEHCPSKSVLTKIPGWSLLRVRADDMHCTKLGLGQHVIGNTLVYLMLSQAFLYLGPAVRKILPDDASNQDILDDLLLRFKEWLKDHSLSCSVKRFTINRVHRDTNSSFPLYSCKASECVPLVAWLASTVLQYSEVCPPSKKPEALVVSNMFWGLSTYFWVCKKASRFFTDAEAEAVNHAGHTFLYMYSELRRTSISEATYMWNITPKWHQFHHLILDSVSDRSNPRYFHCFGDEDQIGKMLLLAAASHSATVVESTVTLYWVGLIRRMYTFKHATPVRV